MAAKFPGASAEAINLLKGLLSIDPRRRLDTDAALAHPYLASVREAERSERSACFTVDTEDIEALELTDSNLKRMMFQVH